MQTYEIYSQQYMADTVLAETTVFVEKELLYNSTITYYYLHLKFDLSLQVGCCGSVGSEDYINARKPVPYECRDRVGGNEYRYGCAQQVWSLTQFYFAGFKRIYSGAPIK